ncbi:hypothetical protein D4S03_08105 [bacterium]|nr:MAG: hypothetical protein D4S03_08105 [bacterium]
MINFVSSVYAADQVVDIGKEVDGFFGYTCIGHLVSNAVAVAFIVAAIAFFVLLVVGGMEWLTSGGDKTKIQDAQKRISNAVIGLAIVATSYAIFTLAINFFGIDLSKLCTANPV